jgi:hypothetical protein
MITTKELLVLKKYLESNLELCVLQELSNKCNSINNYCKNDGAGLLGGCLIDMLISKFFETKLKEYKEHRKGESDMILCDIPLSLKKINGKSTLALNWSKNPTTKEIKSDEKFKNHILLINLKTGQWWKKKPINCEINYNNIIKAGIYIIDKEYCKTNIILEKNNKSNSIINSIDIYKMINQSIEDNLYIELPDPDKKINFDILKAFLE